MDDLSTGRLPRNGLLKKELETEGLIKGGITNDQQVSCLHTLLDTHYMVLLEVLSANLLSKNYGFREG